MENEPTVHKKVESIQFSFFSPKDIKKMATVKIVTPELYDREGYPVDGGLMDTRMGVIDPGLKCRTSGANFRDCLGYFGYIELARPVIHVLYVPLLLILLRCTCRECGRVLIPQNKIGKFTDFLNKVEEESGVEMRRSKVKDVITSIKTVNKCPHCNKKQMTVNLEKPSTFLENEKRISPIEIRTRLEKITDDDLRVFGINPEFIRPEWAVLTIMPIPPVTIRPSITLESGERSEDDLTHKLGDIVRINQRLFENINAGAPEIIIEDLWDLLQYHITTFFDNDIPQLPPARHRSGQPLKTITERIESKEGRIRHNLAGKRTNFSARTVISPDPMLGLNEVGVPFVIATKLTVPERVTEWNIAYLKKFVEKGPKKYPGANYVARPDGKKKKITDETQEQLLEEIQPGYVVERHLMDGDIAIFNRQPSLHRMSMMCHRVRVLPGRTLRLNPAVCYPYNADFDGDEMNLHIPQDEEARAEAEILMQVQTQIISPRHGLSVIGAIQDSISGNYLLTKEMILSRQEAIDMLYQIGVRNFSKLGRKEKVTGKDVFSCLLPDDFNFKGKSKKGDEVIIADGRLIEGVADSNNLGGEAAGLLLRTLHKKYGEEATVDIIEKFCKLGIEVLFKRGFTAALADTDLTDEGTQKVHSVLEEAYTRVDELIDQYKNNQLEIFPGRTLEETLELKILEVLNKARNETGKLVALHTRPDSHTKIMADSGARGNIINMAQMAACVGQQAMRGKRIEKGYTTRTMSCFRKGDLKPAARGFIRGSFKSGLTPSEFFFGAMTGRDSLMDTALRTPKSGYLYRRLANALQDLKVEYDYTVRDTNNKIVQFTYGEDAVDVSKSENGIINVERLAEALKK
ncbi:DNA-directed RNA polymerase subunit A' [Candidatus Woesearchaeota archaeon]|nr:MAG: DNA-directed RNA polymerase subunit A' [archaeon GW2011_AR4]MBS3129491.1 DNA-directed RNA polymerase subunit A' [Candidatus Woesearchaeota archaeon]HIH38872.1 DNA-directed RNA polymerase subunit A' [Candidatus Woesearchaeota archaeon]HIJ03778.1 DNA-directed RNA polymerase subunit A' [Candidatus Woesearchaeota archaeon]